MMKFIGLFLAIILIIFSFVFFHGVCKYFGSLAGMIIGVITTIIIHGVCTKQYKIAVIGSLSVTIIGSVILFLLATYGFFFLVNIHDRFTLDHTLDFQLHGSYSVDLDGTKEYTNVREGAQFAYFIQLGAGNSPMEIHSRNSALDDYGLELPEELLNDAIAFDENSSLLISFGRELREIRYKHMGFFSDGVTSKAKIIFCEEYQDGIIHVYFIKTRVYFWEREFYVIDGDEINFMGEDIRFINEN